MSRHDKRQTENPMELTFNSPTPIPSNHQNQIQDELNVLQITPSSSTEQNASCKINDTSSNLKFIQINLHTSKAATAKLFKFAIENSIDVLLLQDYYHYNCKVVGTLAGWQVFQSPNLTSAIIVTNPLYQAIISYSNKDSIFINLITDSKNITIGSIYSKPNADFLEDMTWLEFFDPLSNIIMGGDLNVRLSLLGYIRENDRQRY